MTRFCPSDWPETENWLLIMTPPVRRSVMSGYFSASSACMVFISATIEGTSVTAGPSGAG